MNLLWFGSNTFGLKHLIVFGNFKPIISLFLATNIMDKCLSVIFCKSDFSCSGRMCDNQIIVMKCLFWLKIE